MQGIVNKFAGFLNRASSSPFRSYMRMSGYTFGLVAVSNFTTSFYDENRRRLILDHPELLSTAILTKSLYFGALWPSFYISAIKYPRNTFYILHQVEEALEKVSPLGSDESSE